MESFHWDTHFVTGLEDVDQQHQNLVKIINQYGELLASDRLVFEDIEALLQQLVGYTQYHFEEEERLMSASNVDKRHQKTHIEKHQAFLHDILAMHVNLAPDKPEGFQKLLPFLTHWLAFHILGTDQNLSRQIKAIQSGTSPEAAYEAEEQLSDNATEPLLIALTALFEQVSARNKELLELNQSLEEKVAERTKALSEANIQLEELALTDILTGLPNRRYAMRSLLYLWHETSANNAHLTCMMVDADHFKIVNDTYGHDAGDVVLKTLAKTLQETVRTDDIVCRLGGDEFFIICPNTDNSGGMHVAELLCKTVSELRVATGDGIWNGSISVGVATCTPAIETHDALIKISDNGVYAAKREGKNCVRCVLN